MKYQGYMPNDFIDGVGVSVSLWVSGCPLKCEGCHNSEAWDPESGYEVPTDIRGQLIKAITANNIFRNFSILGGEPLASYNLNFINNIVVAIKTAFPTIKIYLWTGYALEYLKEEENPLISSILDKIDILIDGPFIQNKRNLTLKLRGSSNQRIWEKDKKNNWRIVNND